MKQKIKTYFKGLFTYLKELQWFKKLLLIFFTFLSVCELIYSVGALLECFAGGSTLFDRELYDTIDDYLIYHSAFVSSTYLLITILLKKINYINCFIIMLLLSVHPIVIFFIGWFPMIMEDIFG